jgi:hypothetical protein
MAGWNFGEVQQTKCGSRTAHPIRMQKRTSKAKINQPGGFSLKEKPPG